MNPTTPQPINGGQPLNQQQINQYRSGLGINTQNPLASTTSQSDPWASFNAAMNPTTPTPAAPNQDKTDEASINSTLASSTAGGKSPWTVQNGTVPGADAVIQDVGQAAKETNNALNAPWSPIGWVTDLIGGATKVIGSGLDAIDNTVAPAIGTALRNMIGAQNADNIGSGIVGAVNSPFGQKAISEYTPALKDVGAVGNVAQLAGTTVAAGQVASGMGDIGNIPSVKAALGTAKGAVGAATDAVTGLPSTIKTRIVGTPPTAPDLVGKITQGTGSDIPVAQRALSSIDTSGVKTFSDLSSQLDSTIKSNTASVDTELGKNTNTFTPEDTTKTIDNGTPNPIQSNPVQDAIDQLKTFYQKTNDTSALADITKLETKYQSGNGLTLQDINNLAREHGSELNGYNANGELASGLSRQAAENTRTALKDFVRTTNAGLNNGTDPTAGIDKNTSDLIKTKGMVDEMTQKVEQLENKIKSYSPLQRLGRFAGKAVNMFSGGMVKGFLRSVMGIGGDQGTSMNALDLQNSLAKNLQLLDKLNSMPPEQVMQEFGNALNNGSTPQ